MAKSRKQFLALLPADKIAVAFGVDTKRAKSIQANLCRHMEFLGDLIIEQAEFIEGQAKTVRLVDRQMDQERDTGQLREEALKFLSGNPVQVEHVLQMVFTDFWRSQFAQLEHEIRLELFAALSKAINSLGEDKEQEH